MADNTEIIEKTGALKLLTEKDRQMLKKYGSKLGSSVCFVLRHHPEKIGVAMDKKAWVSVDELICKFNEHNSRKNFYLSLPVLMEMVRTDNKQRYGLMVLKEELRIRCRQGHSIPWLEMDYREEMPPEVLYHGTVDGFLDSIWAQGLLPMERQKVHLSRDSSTALTVAKRHHEYGQPVVLKVDAKRMKEEGFVFYLSENNVWLADRILPEYLTILESTDE